MLRYKSFTSALFSVFVLTSTIAFADIGTEAGNWQLGTNPLPPKAEMAAKNHNYDAEALAAVGTEAGNWHINSSAPDARALQAAKNHQYDPDALAAIGTEAGNWEPVSSASAKSSSQNIADDGRNKDAVCSEC